jgi:type II secretory pathway pseudopilin PulG
MKRSRAAVTLVELLVAASLFSLVMTAIISFYIEAVAVTAKRDEQSERLRRFHLGLSKIEEAIREGRVVRCGTRVMTLLQLADAKESEGFPLYQRAPVQFVSTREGVVRVQDGQNTLMLPVRPEETVLFGWVQHDPPKPTELKMVRVSLHRQASAKSSELLFSRVIPVLDY